jgi:hypothetical protein
VGVGGITEMEQDSVSSRLQGGETSGVLLEQVEYDLQASPFKPFLEK